MAFTEGWVEADGFRIRYLTAGEGPPLVHLHGAGGLRLNPGHDLLARQFRVIAFEMPGFGAEENQRTRDMPELAATMAKAAQALGLDRFNLMGTSFGGKVGAVPGVAVAGTGPCAGAGSAGGDSSGWHAAGIRHP